MAKRNRPARSKPRCDGCPRPLADQWQPGQTRHPRYPRARAMASELIPNHPVAGRNTEKPGSRWPKGQIGSEKPEAFERQIERVPVGQKTKHPISARGTRFVNLRDNRGGIGLHEGVDHELHRWNKACRRLPLPGSVASVLSVVHPLVRGLPNRQRCPARKGKTGVARFLGELSS